MAAVDLTSIIDDLQYLGRVTSRLTSNWRKSLGSCKGAIHDPTNIIMQVCTKGDATFIFNNLIKWLKQWDTRKSLSEAQLKLGIQYLYAYAVWADFLLHHLEFYPPDGSDKVKGLRNLTQNQKNFGEVVLLTTEKLIGCTGQLSGILLPQINSLKRLPADLVKKREFISDQCLALRVMHLQY